mgnify:CR=1 FL=1
MLFRTLSDHWNSIDGYRIEKYLMLVRHLYKEILHVVLVSHHALQVIKDFMEVIQKEVLLTTENALGVAL